MMYCLVDSINRTHYIGAEPTDGVDTLIRVLLSNSTLHELYEVTVALLFIMAHADSCRKKLAANPTSLTALAAVCVSRETTVQCVYGLNVRNVDVAAFMIRPFETIRNALRTVYAQSTFLFARIQRSLHKPHPSHKWYQYCPACSMPIPVRRLASMPSLVSSKCGPINGMYELYEWQSGIGAAPPIFDRLICWLVIAMANMSVSNFVVRNR